MFQSFLKYCDGGSDALWDLQHQMRVTRLVDDVYTAANTRGLDAYHRTMMTNPHFEWPVITKDVENAVLTQLHTSISIYDQGGVFGEFEDAFKRFHDRPDWYALLHNSGTNALHALFLACGAQPGDEIIFPVYTFHATCSPAMQMGITPVFCDCKEDGTIDPLSIAKRISPATRAVVVTHMWGIPCDMGAILSILSLAPNRHVYLLEDCSHAHGATIDGKMVGTFGDGAAWSLQGQKIISGGEGGIVLTKHADWQYAQLIHGHYNKRCKAEIPTSHPLWAFSLTGAGLKNRAHPVAVAIALNQLSKAPEILKTKREFAAFMADKLGRIPFLKVPEDCEKRQRGVLPAWYAFVVQFNAALAPPGLTRDSFVEALHRARLSEVDIPKSTGLLHTEPLFTRPWVIFPHLYEEERYTKSLGEGTTTEFNTAQKFYDNAIKLPVWGYRTDREVVERYIQVMVSVASHFLHMSENGIDVRLEK